MSEKLLLLAHKAEQAEAEEGEFTDIENETELEPEQLTVEPSEDAEGVAEFVVNTVNGFFRLFEPRLQLDNTVENARKEMAPLIEKYGWHRGKLGSVFGYQPEIQTGLFLGGWVKQIVGQFKALREYDKKRGNQREHTTKQQSHPVSGEVGIREESNTTATGEHS